MPKVFNDSGSIHLSTQFRNHANSLKRNQACHQCRKRKLKCDAKRPCSTCVRSHSYAVAHTSAADRLTLPPHPECTYDDVAVAQPVEAAAAAPPPPAPRSRYERLENRINELENLLREKTTSTSPPSTSPEVDSAQIRLPPSRPATSLSSRADFGVLPVTNEKEPVPQFSATNLSSMYFAPNGDPLNMDFSRFSSGNSLEHLAGLASLMGSSPSSSASGATASTPSTDSQSGQSGPQAAASPDVRILDASPGPTPPIDDVGMSLMFLSWPQDLPDMITTRHLVNTFFNHFMHAHRLFHAPTFLASLDYPPSHPNFPFIGLLHAMCAIGSLYVAGMLPTIDIASDPSGQCGPVRYADPNKPISFGDQQLRYAKLTVGASLDRGQQMFEAAQAQILMTWYYTSQARWVEACLSMATAMRATVPTGMNVSHPFIGITVADPFPERAPSILSPSATVIEEETRRNTFWVAYSMDRHQGAGNGWALNLDDRDITQLLPVRGDQFEQGIFVDNSKRQYSVDKDVLSVHKGGQIDSFILYVKSSILLSRVKNFNLRFRSSVYMDDPSMKKAEPSECSASGALHPRETLAFRELDQLITSLKTNVPLQLKSLINEGRVDPYIYSALSAVHLAQILLHEPFARPGGAACISACRILDASRAIVTLIHNLASTSYDVSLVDVATFLSWQMAGRVLIRFLKAALDAQAHDQIDPLKTEVAFVRNMLARAGERIPVAHRYEKMLYDSLVKTCGGQLAEQMPVNAPPRSTNHVLPQYGYAPTNLYNYKTSPPASKVNEVVEAFHY